MSGAIPLLPQYTFMAWCSVKAQGQLYLYLKTLPAETALRCNMHESRLASPVGDYTEE